MVRTITLTLTGLCLTLTVLCLHFTVCAQGNGNGSRGLEKQPSPSPSVETGGPKSGAALFTIYDGSTIRKGEFTFSVAYSNYDRDPGDVDISDRVSSFNVGLNDHIELFFKANLYRGIKVNSPANLSSFYMPNVGLCTAAPPCIGPAIVLAPARTVGTLAGTTVFRPLNNQPFTQFPFIGSSAGRFVPDAPFIARRYGESSFNYYVLGAKIRLTGPHNPLGIGIIPFYGWYLDNADTAGGFNQSRRGAGPGGSFLRGDVGLIGFVDGRLSKHVNLPFNGSWIFNSNPKSKAMAEATILDLALEYLVDICADFPANKHFQPIAEVRSTIYVGGSTPNALENNPVDVGGIRISAWRGTGAAYCRRLNQPDLSSAIPLLSSQNSNSLAFVDGTPIFERFFLGDEFTIRGYNVRSIIPITPLETFVEARIGNRTSYYTENNPLRHLTLGNFIWDPSVSEQDRQRIRLTIKQGPEDVKKICTLYGADSRKCRDFREAHDSFGLEGVDNGVTVAVGPLQMVGAGAETSVASCGKWTRKTKDNPTGQRTTVTFTKEAVNSEGLIHMVRHEGSHVADGFKWRASGCKISSNPFLRETEFKAYTVTSLSAQAYKPHVAYEFFLPGGGPPGKAPYLPEIVPIYRPGLKAEELETLRDASIDKLLERPKDAGGLYGVTPKSPGGHAFVF